MYENNNISALRARMIEENPPLGSPENLAKWWLLGTSGCHLCNIAEQLMTQLQAVQRMTYRTVDIADFSEPLMMEFATTIPVVLTPSARLNYPFSVLDLQCLFNTPVKQA